MKNDLVKLVEDTLNESPKINMSTFPNLFKKEFDLERLKGSGSMGGSTQFKNVYFSIKKDKKISSVKSEIRKWLKQQGFNKSQYTFDFQVGDTTYGSDYFIGVSDVTGPSRTITLSFLKKSKKTPNSYYKYD